MLVITLGQYSGNIPLNLNIISACLKISFELSLYFIGISYSLWSVRFGLESRKWMNTWFPKSCLPKRKHSAVDFEGGWTCLLCTAGSDMLHGLLNTAGLAAVVVSKSHFDLIVGVRKIFHSAISLLATERSMSINLMWLSLLASIFLTYKWEIITHKVMLLLNEITHANLLIQYLTIVSSHQMSLLSFCFAELCPRAISF